MSSAKSRSFSCLVKVHWMPVFLFVVACFVIQSTTRRKMVGDNKQLTNTGLYLECVRQLPFVYDLAAGVVVQLLYDGNELGREAVVLHEPLDDVTIHTVECLLEVNSLRAGSLVWVGDKELRTGEKNEVRKSEPARELLIF